jgi:cellulose biosynthesis protein BcsQ
MKNLRFNDAIKAALPWIEANAAQLGNKAVIVRDLFGRVRLVLQLDRADFNAEVNQKKLLDENLGRFSPGLDNLFLFQDELLAPDEVFKSPDLQNLPSEHIAKLQILDRQIIGADWLRTPFANTGTTPARVAFFGFKGGAGRSTALYLFARHMARQGQRVLTIDLDLESPGIGNLLLAPAQYPKFGVVDWFVEEAVGQADNSLAKEMLATCQLGEDVSGSIQIVPAHGMSEPDYMAKLSRAYLPLNAGHQTRDFGARLHDMIVTMEKEAKADIVLFDCRAGLHDLAAVALARMNATALLFAVSSSQAWQGYTLLFQHWQKYPEVLSRFRENLKMVDALVPETGRKEHREISLASSHQLFTDTIYEASAADVLEEDVFNYALNDPDAPHYSLPIHWYRAFQNFDPIRQPESVSEADVNANYGEFLNGVSTLLSLT